MIDSFHGEYFFLSNFFETPVFYNGLLFQNSESAFQAMKCPERANEFISLTAGKAKRKGRKIQMRDDWESVKVDIMYKICKAKFEQNSVLKTRLLETGSEELVEGNDWGEYAMDKALIN